MRIARRFTEAGEDVYAAIEFRTTSSEIRNPDGTLVFQSGEIEVPASWSQVACDILAQKYFRKRGVPPRLKRASKRTTCPIVAMALRARRRSPVRPAGRRARRRRDQRQASLRPAGRHLDLLGLEGRLLRQRGRRPGLLRRDALMLARQMAAPNSPQWFNTGLHWAYGIDGPGQGHYYVDYGAASWCAPTAPTSTPSPTPASSSRSPTTWSTTTASWTSGCARRGCSSTARAPGPTSRANLRGEGEPLSGGGKSSGLMSFLKIGDRAAGAIKSGGTTRRAAKMVTVDLDHPDIEKYIAWKVVEEQKVAALVAGSKLCNQHLNAVLQACRRPDKRPTRKRRGGPTPSATGPAKRQSRRPGGPDPGELHPAGPAARRPGRHGDRLQGLRHRLGFRGLPDRLRPELEQLGPGPQRLHRGGADRRRLGADPAHRRRGRQDPQARELWDRSPMPPGPAPTPACSSTPPSTSGTPARAPGGSMRRTPARSTCSWTTRPATWPRST